MPRKLAHPCLLILLLGEVGLGCQSLSGRAPYPEDPLLLAKQPVLGKNDHSPTQPLARVEPAPPPLPPAAFVWAPPASPAIPPPSPRLTTLGAPPVHPPATSPGVPSSSRLAEPRTSTPAFPKVEAIPVARRKSRAPYGHAADYSWLQGVFGYSQEGRPELRYCDPGAQDPWGGKVCVLEDDRLAQLRSGDVIVVEGELVPGQDSPDRWSDQSYPRYRLRDVALVQRKD